MLNRQQLKTFAPFNGLSDSYIDDALSHITTEEFPKGKMLFKRGKAISKRYFLLEGKLDLIDSNYHSIARESGAEEALCVLNPDSPTRCSAIVKSDKALAFSIDAEALDRIVAWSQSTVSTTGEAIDMDPSRRTQPESDLLTSNLGVSEVVVEEYDDGDQGGDWMSSLLQSPLFAKIPLTQVQELFLRFEDVPVRDGDIVIKEGEKGDYFYVLASGKAQVFNRSNSVNLELNPGNYFGDEALLGNTPRNASVQMLSDGLLKRLDASDFAALLISPVLRYVENRVLEKMDKPYQLIDVKMPMEYRLNHVPGSINVPLSRLRSKLPELGSSNVYVVPDDAGSRADIAAHLLCQAGYDALILKSSAAE